MQTYTKKPAPNPWHLAYWSYSLKDASGKVLFHMVIFQTPSPDPNRTGDVLHFLKVNHNYADKSSADLFALQSCKGFTGKPYSESHEGTMYCNWDETNGYWHPTYTPVT